MDDRLKTEWDKLVRAMMAAHSDIESGRMMSADALLCRGKVFVFFSTKGGGIGLGARVGREADVSMLGLSHWQHLAPFKTKPPMKDWIVVGAADQAQWREVADYCYKKALKRT